MKRILKVIGGVILVYIILVGVFWKTGACPEYVNKMPGIATLNPPQNNFSFPEFLYGIGLCPFTKEAW